VHHAEIFPVARRVAGFLEQFAAGGVEDGLAMVDLAGRQFEEDAAQRIAELALEEQAAIVEEADSTR
jgi:hypothetical protein